MNTHASAPPPPPGPRPSTPGQPRLTRRSEDKLVAGVASGLGDHFGVDPVLVRVGFVLLGLFGGGGIVLYLALWVLVPERATGEVVANRLVHEGRRLGSDRGLGFWLGSALIAVAAISLLDGLLDGGILWALVLMAVGVVLFQSDDGRDDDVWSDGSVDVVDRSARPSRFGATGATLTDDVATPVVVDDLGDAWDDDGRSDIASADAGATGVPPVPPVLPHRQRQAQPRRPRAPRERSVLGRITLGVMVLWLAFTWLVGLGAAAVAGGAMAVVGLGLLVGAWIGRARWLLLVGVLLVPFVAGAMFLDDLDVSSDAGNGSHQIAVESGQDRIVDQWFAGEVVLDLRDLGPDAPSAIDVDVALGLGDLQIFVPEHWTLVVDARIDGGEIVVHPADEGRHEKRTGLDQRLVQTFPGATGAPTVTLDLAVDYGNLEIHRIFTTDFPSALDLAIDLEGGLA